jgi:hypothetical protein
MFPKSKAMFYKRDTRAKSCGAELMSKTLQAAGNNPANANPQVPTPSWVASKIARAQADAKNAERDTLASKSSTEVKKTREHFAPQKERR